MLPKAPTWRCPESMGLVGLVGVGLGLWQGEVSPELLECRWLPAMRRGFLEASKVGLPRWHKPPKS